MMSSEWDKLWGEVPEHIGDTVLMTGEWLLEVKAVGDKLQRTIATGYCGECDIHKEKLEAMRTGILEICYALESEADYRGGEGGVFREFETQLRKVLGE